MIRPNTRGACAATQVVGGQSPFKKHSGKNCAIAAEGSTGMAGGGHATAKQLADARRPEATGEFHVDPAAAKAALASQPAAVVAS